MKPRPSAGASLVWLLFALALPSAAAAQAPEASRARNAFAGFETIILPNGLKVWFRRLPGDPGVSINVSVGVGSDQDPPGREELVHFLEHMQFSDHHGRTEEQITREIEDRGGAWNGFTSWDHTWYYVNIDRSHGLFALEWLARIVAPHAMEPALVERERAPVSLEVGARTRQVVDWIVAGYLNPPRLRAPGFWRREFGLTTRFDRDYYPYRSIRRITPQDLLAFYDRWYAPSNITVTIAGDLDRDTVLAAVRSTFGLLAARPAAAAPDSARPREGAHSEYVWAPRPTCCTGRDSG